MLRTRIAALLAALVLIPAAAQAQTTITACYVPNSGSVYRIKTPDTPNACKSNHVEFSWQAEASPWGAVSYVEEVFDIDPGQVASGVAQCPEGQIIMSGGHTTQNPYTSHLVILSSQAVAAIHHKTSWWVTVRNDGSATENVIAHAQCAEYTP